MELNRAALLLKLQQLLAERDDLEPDVEAEHLLAVLIGEKELELQRALGLADYSDVQVEGVGGSGIVISAIFEPQRTRRAIKIPVSRIYASDAEDEVAPDPEIQALARISHQNITRLFGAEKLKGGSGWVIVTEFVEGPQDLASFAHGLLMTEECRDDELARQRAMRSVASVVYEIVDALAYLHREPRILHFDIKPDNLLVSSGAHPYVTDLGFARGMDEYLEEEPVSIGFTARYAHPDIALPDRGLKITKNQAKSRNSVLGNDLSPRFDLFAFGRTLQEVLHGIEREYGESIQADYSYDFLHVVAALCLDGHNAPSRATAEDRFVADVPLGLPAAIFRVHRFVDFEAARVALQRLLGLRRVEDDVPELNLYSSETINVSDFGITTFTRRVRRLLEHPVLRRLSGEPQLGLLDTVFPTATHTRLQHTLGVYHASREYILALYYDPENPLFRALFDIEVARTTLASALLHDVGQTSFGHELEESDPEFSHVEMGVRVLRSEVVDGDGYTINDVLAEVEPDGWGTSSEAVIRLIANDPQTPLESLMRDILDGQLDADKLDYLARDSVEARVQYGRGIDERRFLRSLTTFAVDEEYGRQSKIVLAVKQKGAASAEAFAFARYQLYQSLYWHHTFRAVKGMLFASVAMTFGELRDKTTSDDSSAKPFLDAYLKHALGVRGSQGESSTMSPDFSRRPGIAAQIEAQLGAADEPNSSWRYANDPTLRFLWKLAEGNTRARAMLSDIYQRRYYKRILEVPIALLSEEGRMSLIAQMQGPARVQLLNAAEARLKDALTRAVQARSIISQSLVVDEALEQLDVVTSERIPFVVDLPLRGWAAGGDAPVYVSDSRRRYFRGNAATERGAIRQELWSEGIATLMRGAATFRIYAEPSLHALILRTMSEDNVRHAVEDVVPALKTQPRR